MAHTDSWLLPNRPSIDAWLPGETLFSLCSRHHQLSCNSRPADTCQQLFGHPRAGSAHDFPSRIGHFCKRSYEYLGSAEEIVRSHTVLPFYLPFCEPEDARNAIAAMVGTSTGALKSKLGILASRFGAAHPLKACAQCIEDNQTTHQVAFWHVVHQLPGVWICPLHSSPLITAKSKWTGINRFGWALPCNSAFFSPERSLTDTADLSALVHLSEAAVALWSLPPECHFSATELKHLYRRAMQHQELCNASGRIRVKDFGQTIASYCQPLRNVPELLALPRNSDEAVTQFARLTSGERNSRHPLRHLVLALALFGRWELFWREYLEDRTGLTRDLAVRSFLAGTNALQNCVGKNRFEASVTLTEVIAGSSTRGLCLALPQRSGLVG